MNGVGYSAIAAAVIACIVLFIGMCIFIAGFSVVEPTYMAIARNTISNRIQEDKVYFEGRHYLGVSSEFIYYPMAWQLVEFTDDDATGVVDYICKVEEPLAASTSDGLATEVELSLYFTIAPQELINFYTTYGVNFQDSLSNECKRVLKEVVTQYEYAELFRQRLNISSSMKTALTRALEKRRCKLENILLRGIFFNDALEESIESSVCSGQREIQEGFQADIDGINKTVQLKKLEYQEKINEILSAARREATVIVENARANATNIVAVATSESWKDYQTQTGLTSEQLLRVQWARTLGSTTSADQIAVGYESVGTQFVQKVKST